ncbi:MAG: hypothetical protein Q9174_003645 [Haloplaca sp. 1 TL-2023]
MHSTIASSLALLSSLTASVLGQEQTTTAPIQSVLSVSNLDASQATTLSSVAEATINSYYADVRTEDGFNEAYIAAASVIPTSVLQVAATNPALFFASLHQASDDPPEWYTAMPTPAQEFWSSVGNHVVEVYYDQVTSIRPIPSESSAALSSLSASLASKSSSIISKASADSTSLGAKATGADSQAADAVTGGTPASPLSSGHMELVAGAVAIAAGLVGMALL